MESTIQQLAARYGAEENFEALFELANKVGMLAGQNNKPVPMALVAADIFGKPLPGAEVCVIDEGACGFAWITIRPGNSKPAKAAKKFAGASPAYGGGVQIWVREFNQSVSRKDAYAMAYADVLQAAGVKAYAGSRLD